MVTTSSGEQETTAPRGRDVCVGWGSTENTLHGYCGEVKPEESNSQAEGATQSQCAHHFWNACPPALRHWYLSGQNHTSLLCSLPCPTVHTEGARRKLSKFYPPGLSLSPHTIMTELWWVGNTWTVYKHWNLATGSTLCRIHTKSGCSKDNNNKESTYLLQCFVSLHIYILRTYTTYTTTYVKSI